MTPISSEVDASVLQTSLIPSATTKMYPLSIGCQSCKHLQECGGTREESLFDCSEHCCGRPATCTIVCRRKPSDYVSRKREVGGFSLSNVPRVVAVPHICIPNIIPLVYHPSSRKKSISQQCVALKLMDLVNFRKKAIRFGSGTELRKQFKIDQNSLIILTGVDKDRRIEPWWSLGASTRKCILTQLTDLGIELVTTPNFSMFQNTPRTDDLHARKRIALTFQEFQEAGIRCALHTNFLTETDVIIWSDFVRERNEVQILSYEFITGPRRKDRREFHLAGLAQIAKSAGRDLDIIIRGSPDVIPRLLKHFRRVHYIDSCAFIKSIKRQRARIREDSNYKLAWTFHPTHSTEHLDELVEHNIKEQERYLSTAYFGASQNCNTASI